LLNGIQALYATLLDKIIHTLPFNIGKKNVMPFTAVSDEMQLSAESEPSLYLQQSCQGSELCRWSHFIKNGVNK
jgi:hypothetical protein